jgi:tripartite ATP-independent transporter DctP family solute receptor
MKTMKKGAIMIMVVAMLLTMVACGSGDASNNDEAVKIKFAHWFAEDHPQHLALLKLKELLAERSNGTMVLEIYPNSQLGSEDTFIDSVKAGTVEMGGSGTMLAKLEPKIAASEIPFLFNGWEDAEVVFTSEVGEYITADLPEKTGMRCLAITVNGFRQFSSNKSMMNIEEMEGQRFRVPNVPHFIKMVEGLNANPIALSFTEVFTALEQGVVDGQENPYATIETSSLDEVQEYILESNHMFSPIHWVINEEFYQGLTSEQRDILDKSVIEAQVYNWEISKIADNESKQNLIDNGVTIIEPDNEFKKDLVDSQSSVYEWFYGNYEGSKEVVEKVRNLQASLN